jgi:hypothetical protein
MNVLGTRASGVRSVPVTSSDIGYRTSSCSTTENSLSLSSPQRSGLQSEPVYLHTSIISREVGGVKRMTIASTVVEACRLALFIEKSWLSAAPGACCGNWSVDFYLRRGTEARTFETSIRTSTKGLYSLLWAVLSFENSSLSICLGLIRWWRSRETAFSVLPLLRFEIICLCSSPNSGVPLEVSE